MTTFAIIGAGAGLGAAAARRFGAAGFSVGLIARNQDRLDTLAKDSARTASAPVGTQPTSATPTASPPP